MIEIRNVSKYFNKGKKNQINAIDNTTLSFDQVGLVSLLGQSGCGKTTLLNVIGGLDKVNKGSIHINDKSISVKNTSSIDETRNLLIGYIFQDYKLMNNATVYENVAIVLTMIGLKDKEEIKRRVDYVLEKVGMLRYKKRPVTMLSGGERQRVGIARALVKNPSIILADEPTGNLDSKNSLEIMKIIKAISKDRLVILVTHEQTLAKFYSSRIVEIQDGKVVKDYDNNTDSTLDYEIENRFYLKDFETVNHVESNGSKINLYANTGNKINLDIVIKNGNIYIRSSAKDKIEIVDEQSSVEFVDGHYKEIDKKDMDGYKYDLSEISDDTFEKKYSSIYNPITLVANGFKKIFAYTLLKKAMLLGFLLSSMFIMYAISTVFSVILIKDEYFVKYNDDYLILNEEKMTADMYKNFENLEGTDIIMPSNSIVNFKIRNTDFYQIAGVPLPLSGSLSDVGTVSETDLLYGSLPKEANEILIDVGVINKCHASTDEFKMVGFIETEDFLGRALENGGETSYKIVGITNFNTPSIYADVQNFNSLIYHSFEDKEIYSNHLLGNYALVKDRIVLKEGALPVNDNEVLVHIDQKIFMQLGKTIDISESHTIDLKVVGYYDSEQIDGLYLSNNNTILNILMTGVSQYTIGSNDKEATLATYQNANAKILDGYESSRNEYVDQNQDRINSSLLLSAIFLVISLIEIYLMMRSSFLSRVKEIGVLRAIGVKKTDIYKMFLSEVFAITTLTSLPGILFAAYGLYALSSISYIASLFTINPFSVGSTIILVYTFNILVGLLPVHNTLRKTPSEILARHDLD